MPHSSGWRTWIFEQYWNCTCLPALRSFPLLRLISHPPTLEVAREVRPPERRHLRAAMLAVGLVLVAGTVAGVLTLRLEKRQIHAVALESSAYKDQSIVWQRAAMAEPDILPLYGS